MDAKFKETVEYFEDVEFRTAMDQEEDELSCILEINAGAGGTEACDWAHMLHRMFLMYSDKAGYKTSTLSIVHGDVAGIKSVSVEIKGDYAYGMLKSENYVAVYKDICDVKLAIGKTPLKVILEISELSKNEILKACQICLDAKATFIKTSTGFSKGGATLTAVKMIKKTIKNRAKIKASGGIKDTETALKYIDAGADRIGTSSGIDIVKNNKPTLTKSDY